ncbi:MAG: hypothetical protein J5755_02420, partial [Clostridia bacterium]|nr:hypothetical protein [Clostridia bacterium]
MEDRTLYIFLLTMYMTNALGVVIYCGLFSYSFQRRKLFVLRLILSLIVIGSITNGMAYGLFYGFTHGIETSLRNVELIRIAANVISLLLGIGTLFICYKEKPSLIFFAIIMGYAGNGLGASLYAMLTSLIGIDDIYSTVYGHLSPLSFVLFFVIHLVVFMVLLFTCAKPFERTVKSMDKDITKSIIAMFVLFAFTMTGLQNSNLFHTGYNGATLEAVTYSFHGMVAFIYVMMICFLRFILVWVH